MKKHNKKSKNPYPTKTRLKNQLTKTTEANLNEVIASKAATFVSSRPTAKAGTYDYEKYVIKDLKYSLMAASIVAAILVVLYFTLS